MNALILFAVLAQQPGPPPLPPPRVQETARIGFGLGLGLDFEFGGRRRFRDPYIDPYAVNQFAPRPRLLDRRLLRLLMLQRFLQQQGGGCYR